jgi:hypothetical protein
VAIEVRHEQRGVAAFDALRIDAEQSWCGESFLFEKIQDLCFSTYVLGPVDGAIVYPTTQNASTVTRVRIEDRNQVDRGRDSTGETTNGRYDSARSDGLGNPPQRGWRRTSEL